VEKTNRAKQIIEDFMIAANAPPPDISLHNGFLQSVASCARRNAGIES
jgi:hypothetical protein